VAMKKYNELKDALADLSKCMEQFQAAKCELERCASAVRLAQINCQIARGNLLESASPECDPGAYQLIDRTVAAD
jgi:hypothetical protein